MKENKWEIEVDRWEQEQQICDIANEIIQIFTEKQLSIWKSHEILGKVQATLDNSTRSTVLGTPLVIKGVTNIFNSMLDIKEFAEELNRRKNLCD